MPAPTIHVAHSSPPGQEAKWYGSPVDGSQHGFYGIRTACGASWWTAAWRIIGSIAEVDRSKACEDCLVATHSTEAELHGLDGNR